MHTRVPTHTHAGAELRRRARQHALRLSPVLGSNPKVPVSHLQQIHFITAWLTLTCTLYLKLCHTLGEKKVIYFHCFHFSTVVLGLDISITLLLPIYSSFRILLQIQYTIFKNLWGTAVFVSLFYRFLKIIQLK